MNLIYKGIFFGFEFFCLITKMKKILNSKEIVFFFFFLDF